MKNGWTWISALMASTVLSTAALSQAEESITFEAGNGETVEAFRGSFEVPENRADPDRRLISIGYVRFPSTSDNPGDPIVYLAGGPGGTGTGTARGRRFPLFMAMREHGDVIAYDQRGTGLSENDLPSCQSSFGGDDLARQTDAQFAQDHHDAIEECGVFWREQGVDLDGYTTRESAQDLSDLREHLGAEQLDLWGISYGSHLALAAIKDIPGEIDQVVLASVEGLDQTVKMPARTDAYFARLQAAVNTQPVAAARYSDIAGMVRRVLSRLDDEPVLVDIPQRDGSTAQLLVQRHHAQQFASMLISDPQNAAILLALFASLDGGDTRLLSGLLQRFHTPNETIGLRPMPTAMDIASGIDSARLAAFQREAATGLVGGYLNFPMPQVFGAWDGFDLGDDFREAPMGETEVLVVSGTLDGRTYVDSQSEAVSGLSNAHIVTVHNAGHNLFMSSDEVHATIHAFMRREGDLVSDITVELPDMTQLPF